MLLEALVVTGIVKLFHDTDQSMKLDGHARKKLAAAYEREAMANLLVQRRMQDADAVLVRVMNRKKGIMISSMKQFVELYEILIKINFQVDKSLVIINDWHLSEEEFGELKIMAVKAMNPLSDKELVVSLIKGGIGGAMKEDSERNYSQANRQMRAANMVYPEFATEKSSEASQHMGFHCFFA